MKIISLIMKVLNWIVTVSVAIFAFGWFTNFFNLDQIANLVRSINSGSPSFRLFAVIVVIWLILFNFFYLIGLLFSRKYATHIDFEIGGGKFSISLSAIENSLKRFVKKLPDVHDIDVRVYKPKKLEKPIRIYASYSTWEGTNVKEVTEKIREVVKMRFQEIVEIKEPPEFEIVLSNIVEKEHKKPESKKKELAAEQKVFYGPEYPID